MTAADFDKYAGEYRDIINRVSSVSGEQFEFFIQLRLGLMQERIAVGSGFRGPMRILDFGCGTGTTEKYLKEFFPRAFIFALDASAASIAAAREMALDEVTFVHSESDSLPFPEGYFDLVYSNGTYHHIEPARRGEFLREMYRVCRPGGDLFVFENNPRNPLMMRAMRENPFDEGAVVVYPRLLMEMAAAQGFVCREISYYFFFPRFLRCMRWLEKWLRRVPMGAQYFLWAAKTGG